MFPSSMDEILGQVRDGAGRIVANIDAMASEGVVGDVRRQGEGLLSGIADWVSGREGTLEQWEAEASREVGIQYQLFRIGQAVEAIPGMLSEVVRGVTERP